MIAIRSGNKFVEIEDDKGKRNIRFWSDKSISFEEVNEVIKFLDDSDFEVTENHIRNSPYLLDLARAECSKHVKSYSSSDEKICKKSGKMCLFCAKSEGVYFCGTVRGENEIDKMKECPLDGKRTGKKGKRRVAEQPK